MPETSPDPLHEETVGSERIYEGQIVNLRRDTVRMPDGHEATREVVEHPGAVVVLQVKDQAEGFGVDEAEITLRKYTPPGPDGAAPPRQARFMMVGISSTNDGSTGPSTFNVTSGANTTRSSSSVGAAAGSCSSPVAGPC